METDTVVGLVVSNMRPGGLNWPGKNSDLDQQIFHLLQQDFFIV